MVHNVRLIMDLRPGTRGYSMFWQELVSMENVNPEEAWLESSEPVRLPAHVLCAGTKIVFEYRFEGVQNSVLVMFRIDEVQYWPQGEQTRVHVQPDVESGRIALQEMFKLGWSL